MNHAVPMMAASALASQTYEAGMLAGFPGNAKGLAGAAALANQFAVQAIPQLKGNIVTRRMVQVIIVDPNENIPMAECVLFHGEPKLTDATDQELFFEIDIKNILTTHNEKRTKVIDKKVKERTEYLEEAKIRDLKMVVVNIASF